MQRRSIQVKIAIMILFLAPLACNMPGAVAPMVTIIPAGNDATAIVLTFAAQLTQNASSKNPVNLPEVTTFTPTVTETPTATVTPTLTLTPTITPTPTKTENPIPCNAAAYVMDVTIPDDTQFTVGASFVKTWRLKNSGTCDWTSGYKIIFDHGDHMSGPSEVSFTSGVIAPGHTVDVSVSLKAPSTEGTYTGYYRLKSSDGQIFGIGTDANGAFFVKIRAKAEAALLPDLVISDLSRDGLCSSGCPYKVTVKVKNIGEATAKNFEVDWWGSYKWVSSKSPNCDWPVSSLSSGSTKTLTCQYSYPEDMLYAIPKSKSVADNGGDVDESDEGNNSLTK